MQIVILVFVLLLIIYRIVYDKKLGLIGKVFSLSCQNKSNKIENILLDFLIIEVFIIYVIVKFALLPLELIILMGAMMSMGNQLGISIYKKMKSISNIKK